MLRLIFKALLGLTFGVTLYAKESCELKFGAVPQFEQRKLLQIWAPIISRVEEKTNCKVEIVGSKNIQTFEANFKSGLYDLVYMNPYHLIMAHKAQGYEPLVRSGAKSLKGILVVHKDFSGDHSALNEQTIAFPSPNALGASLLMRAEMAQKLKLNIQPRYVKTHSSVYLHVAKGLLPAGGGVMRTLKQQPKMIQDMVKIIYTTTPVPAHPIAVHGRLSASHKGSLQKALLEIAKEQPELFDKIPMKKAISTKLMDYELLKQMNLEKFEGR